MEFEKEKLLRIKANAENENLKKISTDWVEQSMRSKYVYNFDWLSRPIIQYPQDIVAVQEVIWKVKPDLIIETGIAHGGSLVLSASMLALLDIESSSGIGKAIIPNETKRKVIGIDIDIRKHNKEAIESHPMYPWIDMIEGSSIDADIADRVKRIAKDYATVLVFLDSNHTYDHVWKELNFYAPLVTTGSYCVVFDTFVNYMPDDLFPDRPWNRNDNPLKAVNEYIRENTEFQVDSDMSDKLLISATPGGFLKKV